MRLFLFAKSKKQIFNRIYQKQDFIDLNKRLKSINRKKYRNNKGKFIYFKQQK